MKSTTERYLDIITRNIDESPLLLIAKTAAPTLIFDILHILKASTLPIFDILHILKASTLLQATAILKALITEFWKRPTAGLKHHYLCGLAVDPANPTLLLYRHLNRLGKHIPLKVRIH
jgi:hypothetical protein